MKITNRLTLASLILGFVVTANAGELTRLRYNNPGLVVDLGVGLYAWPLPMDYDGDGDLDLVVSSPDAIQNSLTFFENPGGNGKLPVFKPGVRLSATVPNLQISYEDGEPRILGPNVEYKDFLKWQTPTTHRLGLKKDIHKNPVRANQWKYVDYDNDGALDLVIGVEDWTDYGWDDAFDEKGHWTRGPLHGFVYLARNEGSNGEPNYAKPIKLECEAGVIDVYGMPSPNFADFDGDGDLDLLCGEFVDRLTYFENVGTRNEPRYAKGKFFKLGNELFKIDCCMFVPVAIDWDQDGDMDLVIGQEDGRVMFCEHSGQVVDGMPAFLAPQFFQQQADEVKLGVLATPTAYDWDGDGDQDLISGDASGRVGWFENLGGDPPRWQPVNYLEADDQIIRIQAGENGSIQGPCESKWGYTVPCVADWDKDGLPDLMLNSILGRIVWYRNVGTRNDPRLAAAEPVKIAWQDKARYPAWNWWQPANNELATHWRSSAQAFDVNQDGYLDLVTLDDEGFLVAALRLPDENELTFAPGERIFSIKGEGVSAFDQRHDKALLDENGDTKNDFTSVDQEKKLAYSYFAHEKGKKVPAIKSHTSLTVAEDIQALRLSIGWAGQSGRRTFVFTDWDNDGKTDLLVNSLNVNVLRNVAEKPGEFVFEDIGPVSDFKLAGHNTCPTLLEWGGKRRLVIGAEDGCFYVLDEKAFEGK